MSARLSLAIETGHVALPAGPCLVIGAGPDSDLSAFDRATTVAAARFRDAHDALSRAGWRSAEAPEGPFASAVVFAPRAREAQRAALRLARGATAGPIIVDGPKTNGVDAFYRELRARAEVSAAWSKAHGKVFEVAGGDFGDWPDEHPAEGGDGWWRAAGVFSADGVDKASTELAEQLPGALPGRLIDLGAGWGYLSRAILARGGVTALHLVENDRAALAAAKRNIADDRAAFHWADALTWAPPDLADHVVMNPPFHVGRKADPELGRAFVRAAAGMLKPKGSLWLVANRQLPYETTLGETFGEVREVGRNPAFKVLCAERPRTPRKDGATR